MMIRVDKVTKRYGVGSEGLDALGGVSFEVQKGEFVTVMGESGSGKSTLLALIGGMSHPTSGRVEIAGTEIYTLSGEELADFRAATLGFVFQSFHLIPYLTAMENVMLPLAIVSMPVKKKRQLALDALERVGLGGKEERLPSRLSGGEQERVAIARAIVRTPCILLADEPTGNLDTVTGEEIISLFRRLNAQGATIVMVTHNPMIGQVSDRTIRLRDGRVVE
ncbi:MAG: ABC transporter ATP-binding protein [Desulfuromonadia bacterium]